MHVYQLLLVRNEQSFEYATIVEIHHPDYLSENDLQQLYKYEPTTAPSTQIISDLVTLVLRDQ